MMFNPEFSSRVWSKIVGLSDSSPAIRKGPKLSKRAIFAGALWEIQTVNLESPVINTPFYFVSLR